MDKSYKSATKSIALSIHCNDANFRLSLKQLIACCKFLLFCFCIFFIITFAHFFFSNLIFELIHLYIYNIPKISFVQTKQPAIKKSIAVSYTFILPNLYFISFTISAVSSFLFVLKWKKWSFCNHTNFNRIFIIPPQIFIRLITFHTALQDFFLFKPDELPYQMLLLS